MRSIARSRWRYVFDLIIFSGFPIVSYLAENELAFNLKCNDKGFFECYQLPLYIVVCAFYLISLELFTNALKAKVSDVENVSDTIQVVFSRVLQNYYLKVKSLRGEDSEPPAIRINIMIRTKAWLFGREFLKMCFTAGVPSDYNYSELEKNIRWKKNQGACGIAWAERRFVPYSPANAKLQHPQKSLTPEQLRIVNDRESVLSIPIWSKFSENKDVFAVLNFDSDLGVDETLLDDQDLILILRESTVLASYVLSDFHAGLRL